MVGEERIKTEGEIGPDLFCPSEFRLPLTFVWLRVL